jgi:hypothetical protein
MKPVPSRVVQSYHVRYQLQTIMPEGGGPPRLPEAIDVHAHAQTGTEHPLGMAQRASQAGMGGVVFKNLLTGVAPWASCAEVVDQLERWAETERVEPVQCYFGCLTDTFQGGLDFDRVRETVERGAACVWFPVISSAHSLHRVGGIRRSLVASDGYEVGHDESIAVWPLAWEEALRHGQYLLDEQGRLKPIAREILRLVADKGVPCSFAHSSKPEMEALAEECQRLGYHQAFIDHPYGPQVGLELEDLSPFAEAGIYFNFTFDEISPLLGVDPKDMMDTIAAIGPEHFTLSSDGGNPLLPGAVEALDTLVRYARAYGISEEGIRLMTVDNPRRILGSDRAAA